MQVQDLSQSEFMEAMQRPHTVVFTSVEVDCKNHTSSKLLVLPSMFSGIKMKGKKRKASIDMSLERQLTPCAESEVENIVLERARGQFARMVISKGEDSPLLNQVTETIDTRYPDQVFFENNLKTLGSSPQTLFVLLFHSPPKAALIKRLLKFETSPNTAVFIVDDVPSSYSKVFLNFPVIKGVFATTD